MKKCVECKYVFLNEYREPVSCSFGLIDGCMPIGSYCEKTKRKIRRNEKPNKMQVVQ